MEAAFSTQPSAISENQQQKQKPFTTEDAEESKGLPLMNADERGLQDRVKQVEWKPTPDMYKNRSWGELPVSVLETETVSGSFDAPSSLTGTRACSG